MQFSLKLTFSSGKKNRLHPFGINMFPVPSCISRHTLRCLNYCIFYHIGHYLTPPQLGQPSSEVFIPLNTSKCFAKNRLIQPNALDRPRMSLHIGITVVTCIILITTSAFFVQPFATRSLLDQCRDLLLSNVTGGLGVVDGVSINDW